MYRPILAGVTALGVSFYFIRRYIKGRVCQSKALLNGKTVIITGANTGIGLETAIDLAKRNARVILACRSVERGERAVMEARTRSNSDNIELVQLDLSSLASIRWFAAKILDEEPHIDILVNNAGVMGCPYSKTKDGFEMQFGVNHLGHFLLTNLLLERMKEAPSARIINVSSRGHWMGKIDFDDLNSERSYSRLGAYGRSKLANLVFTHTLSKRLVGTNVTVNAVHPGTVRTELFRNFNIVLRTIIAPLIPFFLKTPWEGAQTTIYCAVSEEVEGVSGKYFVDCKIKQPSNREAFDDEIGERLWQVSSQMVGLPTDT